MDRENCHRKHPTQALQTVLQRGQLAGLRVQHLGASDRRAGPDSWGRVPALPGGRAVAGASSAAAVPGNGAREWASLLGQTGALRGGRRLRIGVSEQAGPTHTCVPLTDAATTAT